MMHFGSVDSLRGFDRDLSVLVCIFVSKCVPVKAAGVKVPGVPQTRAWTNSPLTVLRKTVLEILHLVSRVKSALDTLRQHVWKDPVATSKHP